MKSRRTLLFVLAFLLPALTLISCTKIDTPPDSPVVTANWYWLDWSTDKNKNGMIDNGETLNQRLTETRIIFNTDGTGKYTDDNFPAVPLNWSLNGQHLDIHFSTHIPGFDATSYHIDSLTTHVMILSDTDLVGRIEWRTFGR